MFQPIPGNPITYPHYGTADKNSQENFKINERLSNFSDKKIVLLQCRKGDNPTGKDLYAIDESRNGRSGCLTIYAPFFENPKDIKERYFENGSANEISTDFKTIYLINFIVGSILFRDAMGNPTRGLVIMDSSSRIKDLNNTNARIIKTNATINKVQDCFMRFFLALKKLYNKVVNF